jgi:hypothetical protein
MVPAFSKIGTEKSIGLTAYHPIPPTPPEEDIVPWYDWTCVTALPSADLSRIRGQEESPTRSSISAMPAQAKTHRESRLGSSESERLR